MSNPPPDDTILTDSQEQSPAKPPAGHPLEAQPATAAQPTMATQPPGMAQPAPAYRRMSTGTDDGIVQVQQAPSSTMPSLANRPYFPDADGDIVHLQPLGPGELREGTMIRVRLLNGLSSTLTQQGEQFRSRVATDVTEGGVVVIPAGAEISGRVVDVSAGRFAGHGTLLLKPETVTLADGESFNLHAMVMSAPGTHTRVDGEGVIGPDSRKKRAGIEYGGAVGAGVIAGAYLGGPVGALAGGMVGAAVVTTHLLVSHPQARLEEGDVLMLTLTEQTRLVPAGVRGE